MALSLSRDVDTGPIAAANAAEIVQGFQQALATGDFASARKHLHDNLSFRGPIDMFDKLELYVEFDRRVHRLGVTRIRTPVRAPRTNALAERWIRSARRECLDHVGILNECHLQRVLDEYVAYFNAWRPHQGLGQRAPCGSAPRSARGPCSHNPPW